MRRYPDERQQAFERFSRAVDGPMMVLALLMIPLLLVPFVVHLEGGLERAFLAADYLIWALFAVEYVANLYLAPDRKRFVKGNIPDLVVVVIPMLRPLRILRSVRLVRVLRLTRLLSFAVEGLTEIRAVLSRRGLNYVLLIALALIFVGAGPAFGFEHGAKGSNISSYPDALWWAVTTVATVGYGDRFPVTAAGRGVAVVLMLAGIAVFGVITASIAAHFVEREAEQDMNAKLDGIAERLTAIEARLP